MQPSAGSWSDRPGPDSGPGGPGLKRVLGLPALVLYGLILIQPTAPMPLYGNVAGLAHGHVVTTVLIGMVAMLFTAIAYGRMANAYPSAGSAYTYVGREIHPALGYLVGWGMIFDYVMNPIICVIWSSQAALALQVDLGLQMPALFTPKVLFVVYVFFFTALFTGMNVRGIEASSRTNTIIAAGLGVVIVLFLAAAAQYLWARPPAGMAGWTRPFYDPKTFSFSAVSNGAALAVLTYIGFDGISTLSEEVHNPRRNILLATVLVCLLTGVLASIQVYAAQLVWPDANTKFSNLDLAFCNVAGKAGGRWLFLTVDAALLIATIGSGAGAQLGPAACFMAWAVTTRFRAGSSASSIPARASPATTSSWSAPSPSSGPSRSLMARVPSCSISAPWWPSWASMSPRSSATLSAANASSLAALRLRQWASPSASSSG